MKFFIVFLLLIKSYANAGVILQGFYWDAQVPQEELQKKNLTWWQYLTKQSSEISKSGFTAIWLPPVFKGASGGYSNGYDMFDDYDIGSKNQKGTLETKWGSRQQLINLAAQLRADGLDIYLDMNLNHRMGDPGDKNFTYLSAKKNHLGRFSKSNFDFDIFDSEFGRQLNQNNLRVQEELKKAGDWITKTLDIQGMRFDYAKADSPDFVKSYLNYESMKNHFAVVEHWTDQYQILDFINKSQSRVSAFDFPLWSELKSLSNSFGFYDMRRLQNAGLIRLKPFNSVTFVENHDTDRDYPSFNKKLAYAFILTSEGYPSVFWKDYYIYNMKSFIDNLIWIHEILADGETLFRWADQNVIAYERLGKNKLVVALNNHMNEYKKIKIFTSYSKDLKLHDYSGNCKDIVVSENGEVELDIPPNSFVAYSLVGLNQSMTKKSYKVTQEISGDDDLDLPALSDSWLEVAKIWIDPKEKIDSEIFFDIGLGLFENELEIQIKDLENSEIIFQKQFKLSNQISFNYQKMPTDYEAKHYLVSARLINSGLNIPFWWKITYKAQQILN